jgi:response regulator of citrate/malate metabolism
MQGNPAYEHIPVIITSTSSTNTTIKKCISLGAASYLVKPETFIMYEPFVKQLYKLIEDHELVK